VAAVLVLPVAALEALRGLFFVAGLIFPVADEYESRNIVREWWARSEARAVDQMLERTLAEKWEASQTFELTEVIREPMTKACLATWKHWRKDDPAWELAWRSDRPVWWRTFTGNSTVMVEFSSGVVRAFRTKYHRRWPRMGVVIRFQPPHYMAHVCAAGGRLRFEPVKYDWGAYVFRAIGD